MKSAWEAVLPRITTAAGVFGHRFGSARRPIIEDFSLRLVLLQKGLMRLSDNLIIPSPLTGEGEGGGDPPPLHPLPPGEGKGDVGQAHMG